MADLADRLLDLTVRHRIDLGRYSTSVVRRVLAVLNQTDKDLVERIARADNLGRNSGQLELLLQEVRAAIAAGWSRVGAVVQTDLSALSGAEVEFVQGLLTAASVELQSQALTGPQVYAAATARPFQGRLLREWLSEAEEGAARRVRDAVRIGFVESQTVDEIVRRVRGTRANGYKDGILEISRRGAETMVRTAVTHTASVAAEETYRQAADYIEGVEWVSTLDSRTSLICASRDGKVYPIDKGPRPPAHPNCRSTTIPRLKGMAPFPRKKFEEWLRDQPKGVQDDVLGPARAALYRAGKLPIDRFVDGGGRTLSLEQLKARNEAAFQDIERAAKRGSAPPVFTDRELGALEEYTGSGHTRINSFLRGERSATPELLDTISALDDAMARSRLVEDITVYRGIKGHVVPTLGEISYGAVVQDNAFLSTSRRLEEAKAFTDEAGLMMVIRARAGQRGMDVSEVAALGTAEREILFARRSRLRVLEWRDGERTLYLERLPDEDEGT